MADLHSLEQLSEFRVLISGELADFVEASSALGELMTTLAVKVQRAFEVQYSFILSGVQMNRPTDESLNRMLDPLCTIVNEIQELRNSNRHNEAFFNHLSAVSESIMALSWVARAAPARFVREMKDAGDYFGNRVLSANRSNPPHVQFIRNWGQVLTALENYVLQNHRTGFEWAAAVRAGFVAVADVNMPPPPPPPPLQQQQQAAAGQPDRSALFQQINARGENIAGMLRPARARGPHTISTGAQGFSEPTPVFVPPPKEPKFALEGKKWIIEHQKKNYALVLEAQDKSQSAFMFQCEEIGLDARNKMNGITIENTKRSTIAVSDIIAAVELIRCSNVTLQCNGVIPTISLDRCDSVQIFLTHTALGVDIITSNCTSLNVCIVTEDGSYVELPIPEQIRTVVSNGKLLSSVVDKH